MVVAVAFVLRLIAGLSRGPGFVGEGYSIYADLARTFWDGHGLCYAPGEGCTIRMPLYPVLAAPFLAAGTAYPWLMVLQAAIGATLPLIAFGIGRHLFTTRIAWIAAAGVALDPYAIVHGAGFQETVVFNALLAASVLLLFNAVRSRGAGTSAAAGLALALATLTTARMVLFLPVALAWLASRRGNAPPRLRMARVVLASIPIVALLSGWMARNASVVGRPTLSTEFGLSLWLGSHEETRRRVPAESIDRVTTVAWNGLPDGHRRRLIELGDDPVEQDRFYASLAVSQIARRPGDTALSMAKKVALSFAGYLSPARPWPIQLAYAAMFLPLNVLALAGVWRVRHAGGGHLLVALLFASFAVTTALFWAHTSHKSFLHPFLFLYAASVIVRPAPAAAPGGGACRCSAS